MAAHAAEFPGDLIIRATVGPVYGIARSSYAPPAVPRSGGGGKSVTGSMRRIRCILAHVQPVAGL
jgi:hypothetical protein